MLPQMWHKVWHPRSIGGWDCRSTDVLPKAGWARNPPFSLQVLKKKEPCVFKINSQKCSGNVWDRSASVLFQFSEAEAKLVLDSLVFSASFTARWSRGEEALSPNSSGLSRPLCWGVKAVCAVSPLDLHSSSSRTWI